MWNITLTLLATEGLVPHGHCLLWQPALLYLHVVSDLMTAAAYFSIPVAMAYFVVKRQDLHFRFVFILFAAFIFACGTTHVMSAWTIWQPHYWLQGWIKALTALVSVGTSMLLWWLIPKVLALPSPQDLEKVNNQLRCEIQERIGAEETVRRLNASLEARVALRTLELQTVNRALAAEVRERKQVEEQLKQAAAAFQATHEGMIITDAQERIVNVNRAFSAITGYGAEDVLGQTPRLLKSGRHPPSFYETMWASLAACGLWRGEIWNRRKSGAIAAELMTISVVRGADGAVANYVGVFSDITYLKETEARLEFMANHDALTELPNRRMLERQLEHAVKAAARHGQPLALLLVDLDRFKDVNDSFGHPTGDELLKEVVRRFKGRLRASDTLARLGGDEFAVLLEQVDHPHLAGKVAQDLLNTLTAPVHFANGAEIVVSASIGISQFPLDGETGVDLIQHADAALYQAKAQGRRTFRFYTRALTHAAQERISLEARLRHALESEHLEVHYQPQWDIRRNCIAGVEALVRWPLAQDAYMPPTRFIPVAEETGLIIELGEWVLRTVCRHSRSWAEAGLPPVRMAVNISPRQFAQADLAEQVDAVLRDTGVEPHRLEVELTESALMSEADDVLWFLEKLKATGVSIAIDDFGTGYSSLAYLKRFPVNTLKIDREFVKDIPLHRDDMKITTAIVQMAHALGFTVLAEGVETDAQLAFLQEQACDVYQGYLFSPPLPPDDIARLLATSAAC